MKRRDPRLYAVSAAWSFFINGIERYQVHESAICWNVDMLYWFAEAYEYGSALGGSQADPVTISVARWLLNGSTNWQSPNWGVGVDCANAGGPVDYCEKSASDALDFWSHY